MYVIFHRRLASNFIIYTRKPHEKQKNEKNSKATHCSLFRIHTLNRSASEFDFWKLSDCKACQWWLYLERLKCNVQPLKRDHKHTYIFIVCYWSNKENRHSHREREICISHWRKISLCMLRITTFLYST